MKDLTSQFDAIWGAPTPVKGVNTGRSEEIRQLGQTSAQSTTPTKNPNYLENLGSDYMNSAKELTSAVMTKPNIGINDNPLEVVGKVAGTGIHDIGKGVMAGWGAIFAPLQAIGQTVLPKNEKEKSGKTDYIRDIERAGISFAPLGPVASAAAMAITGGFQALNAGLDKLEQDPKTSQIFKDHPTLKEDINNVAGTALSLMGAFQKKGVPGTDVLNSPIKDYPKNLLKSYGIGENIVPAKADTPANERFISREQIQHTLSDLGNKEVNVTDRLGNNSKIINGKFKSFNELEQAIRSSLTPEEVKALSNPNVGYKGGDFERVIGMKNHYLSDEFINDAAKLSGRNPEEIRSKMFETTSKLPVSKLGENVIEGAAEALRGGKAKATPEFLKAQEEFKSNTAIKNATPDVTQLSPTERQTLLEEGKLTPQKGTKVAQVNLTPEETVFINKHSDLLQGKTAIDNYYNVAARVFEQDASIGEYLKEQGIKYDKADLKKKIQDEVKNIQPAVTSNTKTFNTAKTRTVNAVIKKLTGDGLEDLWKDRKTLDRNIENEFNAFEGTPTAKKQMAKAIRNTIQNYIEDQVGDGVYKDTMKDMSKLIDLNENTIAIKALKEMNKTELQNYLKMHPFQAKIMRTMGGLLKLGGVLEVVNGN